MIATYRVQLTPRFDFDAAAAIVPYLARLGVSHAYTSPYLQAAPGSTHGYDVVDYTRVNEELGGDKGRQWFCRALDEAGMSHVVDMVPNHMAIGGPENAWWWDVLENGMSSRFARFFDVDWEFSGGPQNRILLPILGEHYGRVIESGEIRLERSGGSFRLRYYEHVAPVSPRTLTGLLGRAAQRASSPELGFVAGALEKLPASSATDLDSVERRHRDKEVLRSYLADRLDSRPNERRAVDAETAAINDDVELLDELHEAQNYRMAHWRLAGSDLGYRRFFDINTLAGLRMEDDEVFRETHQSVLEWLADGSVTGLRIDHPDGLRNPRQYLQRLRNAAPDTWIVAEKILEDGEPLPRSWQIDGTTGYDLLTTIDQLFVDRSAEQRIAEIYRAFTGEERSYHEILHQAKHEALDQLFASDLARLVDLFSVICAAHRESRDFSTEAIEAALSEVIVAMPVYRTYVVARDIEISDNDRSIIAAAVSTAREQLPQYHESLFDFVERVLTLQVVGEAESEFVMRFQQLSAPAMAKGAEDTAFYRYNRLLSLNEVGGNPSRFGITATEFHAKMRERADRWPLSMSTASTHDTKRSEDTRQRITALSTIPAQWQTYLRDAHELSTPHRSASAPDPNLEYAIYQNMIGAWPLSADRLWGFAQKAMREEKRHTSWTRPEAEYEAAVESFVNGISTDERFLARTESFVQTIRMRGWHNSLAATILRFTVPGVPDIYQGCELWDHSLVDPDNRRPIDYDQRIKLLDALDGLKPGAAFDDWENGLAKLYVIKSCLVLRRTYPDAFGPEGSYESLAIDGPHADSYIAFSRGRRVVVVVRRFDLDDAAVALPAGEWHELLTERRIDVSGSESRRPGPTAVVELLGAVPGAILVRDGDNDES